MERKRQRIAVTHALIARHTNVSHSPFRTDPDDGRVR